MTLAALHVTKCRLCGQPQAGPEGLCSDCSRALARARQGSAALKSAPAASPRKARAVERIVLTSPVESEVVRTPARGRAVLWAVIGMVAVVLVLVGTAGLSPPRIVEPKVSERAARIVPPLHEPASENDDPAETEALPAPQRKASVGDESPSSQKESTRAPVTRPARSAASALSGARPASDAKSGDAAGANGAAAPTAEIEPPVQQAHANVAASGANGDDGQALASALERCNEEKFLAGVICEQKVRLRYCEGKWGQVPQCTAKPRVD
jgi:hypothetical protein